MNAWERLMERYVLKEELPRDEVYRREAARMRTGDGLSWAVLLIGFVPLALENLRLAPVWIGLAIAAVVGLHRGWSLGDESSKRAAFASMLTAIVYFGGTGDVMWAFVVFLVMIALVLIHKTDLQVEVPRVYLIAFTLFLVFAHLTLEYSFLVVLFGMVLSGIMLMLRYHFPEQLKRGRYLSTARILAKPVLFAVAMAAPIFVICPRVPVATLKLQQAPHTGGFSDKIRFGDMRGALDSDRVFMTVRTPKAHKWRGIVLDFYDGKGWRRTPRQGKRHEAGNDNMIWLPHQRRKELASLESAEVILEPTDCRYYFSPQWPVAMESEFGSVDQDGARVLIRTEDPQVKRIRYTLWFGTLIPKDAPGETEDIAKYKKLLPHLPPSIGELARRATSGAKSDRQRCEMLDRFLAEGEYTYTLGAAPPAGRDPVEWFLTESKSGHCEYFSSAMALMLRTLGIPSRVVNGFNPGKYDAFAGTWTVREQNCHSWVEAYLEGEGWVEFDPTTGNGREPVTTLAQRLGIDQFQFYQIGTGLLNQLDFEWQRCVVSFSVSSQWELLQWIYRAYEEFEIRVRMWWMQLRLVRPSAIAGTLAVLVLFGRMARRPLALLWRRLHALLAPFLAWLWRELTRTRTRKTGEVAPFWRDLVEILERNGILRGAHETPWELARRVESVDAALGTPARVVADAYCKVAYRGQALGAPELEAVRTSLAALADRLRQRRVRPVQIM